MNRHIEKSCQNCDHFDWVPRDEPGHGYCGAEGKHFKYGFDLTSWHCEKWEDRDIEKHQRKHNADAKKTQS